MDSHYHHLTNLWSWYPDECVFAGPCWSEVMQLFVQVGPPANVPASTPRSLPDPPRGRTMEPLHSRTPGLRSVLSQSRMPSDRHREEQQLSAIIHAAFAVVDLFCGAAGSEEHFAWSVAFISAVSHSLKGYYQLFSIVVLFRGHSLSWCYL